MKILRYLLSFFLLTLLGLTVLFVFNWQYFHDSPIFFYVSMAIDKFGIVPYRDLYEINFPGTYLAYLVIGKLTGYSVLGVRIADYVILAIILVLGWLWMRKLSGWAGLFGGIAWALAYFSMGPGNMVQRDYLLLIPILCGLAAYTNIPSNHPRWRCVLTGLCIGAAATIKPQAFLALLPMFAMEWHSQTAESGPGPGKKGLGLFRRNFFWLIAGFLIPLAVMFLYLVIAGALPKFMEIVFEYLPLFAQMNANHQAVSGVRRIFFLITDYGKLGGYGIWLAPALLGALLFHQSSEISPEKKRHSEVLLLLAIALSIFPVLSGQYYIQHWLPFYFFLFQASFLSLVAKASASRPLFRWLPAAALLIASITLIRPDTIDNLWLLLVKHELPAANNPKEGRVDEIADFLESHLQPGDTVQPLDWIGGSVQAMLIAKAKIATPYIYDEYFYHNVNSPYILQLRKWFMDDLQRAMPRYIIEVYDDGPYAEPTGRNTSREFPEFRAFLAEYYSVVQEGQGYRIYELRPDCLAPCQPDRKTALAGGFSIWQC